MKHYYDDFEDTQKPLNTPLAREQKAGGFRCAHCRTWVVINPYIGTANRNHCSLCLWSKHVDISKGDRRAECRVGMQPIALTFKHEGYDRYGEIMLVHECKGCGKISINRIAGDDNEPEILRVLDESADGSKLREQSIDALTQDDRGEVCRQLFGVQ